MKRSAPILRTTPLRRISFRRALQVRRYAEDRRTFLRAHPYCQVWLNEHNISESVAIARGGLVSYIVLGPPGTGAGCLIESRAPRSTEIHHIAKRRGARLLDKAYWLAVCRRSHERIERDKAWARERGYLANF